MPEHVIWEDEKLGTREGMRGYLKELFPAMLWDEITDDDKVFSRSFCVCVSVCVSVSVSVSVPVSVSVSVSVPVSLSLLFPACLSAYRLASPSLLLPSVSLPPSFPSSLSSFVTAPSHLAPAPPTTPRVPSAGKLCQVSRRPVPSPPGPYPPPTPLCAR
eukprot:203232-Rhodomonas_salina.1